MKIHILFKFMDGPWGGGNQFLKCLRDYFKHIGVYENDPEKADVILFNSHHYINKVVNIKRKYPGKIIIHRVDGPVFLIRGGDSKTDKIIFESNNRLSEGTIFQSHWSKTKCYELGFKGAMYEEVIFNAPAPGIFYTKDKKSSKNRKIKIIATSWSSNFKKGFSIYKYLDEKLDFSKYEMTFVGNSPIKFDNIRYIQPLQSAKLADELRKHDIFITASLDDPCSNSLIEALNCGLPAVVRNSGGHPEIIGKSGVSFQGIEDVCDAIAIVAKNISMYSKNIKPLVISDIGRKYYQFGKNIFNDVTSKKHRTKKLPLLSSTNLLLSLKIIESLSKLKNKFKLSLSCEKIS